MLEEPNATVKGEGPDSSVPSFFITEWKLESSTRQICSPAKSTLEMMPSVAADKNSHEGMKIEKHAALKLDVVKVCVSLNVCLREGGVGTSTCCGRLLWSWGGGGG